MSLTGRIAGDQKKSEVVPDRQIVVAGTTLYRIRARKDFGKVKAGDLGGFVGSERKLSQDGDCWVADDAQVYDQAVISDDAQIYGRGRVYDHGRVSDRGQVLGNGQLFENGGVFRNGVVFDNAKVFGPPPVRHTTLPYADSDILYPLPVLTHGH